MSMWFFLHRLEFLGLVVFGCHVRATGLGFCDGSRHTLCPTSSCLHLSCVFTLRSRRVSASTPARSCTKLHAPCTSRWKALALSLSFHMLVVMNIALFLDSFYSVLLAELVCSDVIKSICVYCVLIVWFQLRECCVQGVFCACVFCGPLCMDCRPSWAFSVSFTEMSCVSANACNLTASKFPPR